MLTDGASMTCCPESKSAALREQLLQKVHCKTYHQVRDLQVRQDGRRVVVTGTSRSYYVKQLVTQAVLTLAPTLKLDNEIHVNTGC